MRMTGAITSIQCATGIRLSLIPISRSFQRLRTGFRGSRRVKRSHDETENGDSDVRVSADCRRAEGLRVLEFGGAQGNWPEACGQGGWSEVRIPTAGAVRESLHDAGAS